MRVEGVVSWEKTARLNTRSPGINMPPGKGLKAPGTGKDKPMDENAMRLILLGTGTGIPSGDRASPSLILLTEGGPVLFDMGPGTLRRLASLGIPFDRISQVCLTHFHPDHTADLIHFLFATRHPSVLERRKPFRMIAPLGFQDFLKRVRAAYAHWLDLPPELLEIEELDTNAPDERTFENFRISTRPTDHTPHSLAYRVESLGGRSFVYSGDTGFCDEINAQLRQHLLK